MKLLDFHIIPILLLALAICACKKADTVQVSSVLYQSSTLPISDASEVPKPVVGIGIESGVYMFSWKACSNADGYEIEQYRDFGKWELIYSGSDTRYEVGIISNGGAYYYRVRAIYKTVVSKWSEILNVP